MQGQAFAGIHSKCLFVDVSDTIDWFIVIRRADGRSDSLFRKYSTYPVSPDTIAQFIPRWSSLFWQANNGGVAGCLTWAVDETYQIHLMASLPFPPSRAELITAFKNYMDCVGIVEQGRHHR